MRTLFATYDVPGETRNVVYGVLGVVWITALTIVVRRLRRDGQPLLQRRLVAEGA
jgi:hypothetical protein